MTPRPPWDPSVWEVPYAGKATCCHSQALLSAFAPPDGAIPIELFEAFTTIPFGVVSVADDPNRLLNCVCDPDLGLDRALTALVVPFEVAWAPDAEEALARLRRWCGEGPVVLGPVDMDRLPYLLHPHLFAGCDHYVVVVAEEDDEFELRDPEGSVTAFVSGEELACAWRGARIPEGRAPYTMRRAGKWPENAPSPAAFRATLAHAAANLRQAAGHPRGGPRAFAVLASAAEALQRDPSFRRGLTYAIPTRIQRCIFARAYLLDPRAPWPRRAVEPVVQLLEAQVELMGEMLAELMEGYSGALRALEAVGRLEWRMTERVTALVEAV